MDNDKAGRYWGHNNKISADVFWSILQVGLTSSTINMCKGSLQN